MSFSRNNAKDSLDNLGRSSTCISLLAVEFTAMVFNALQINTFLVKSANQKKKNPFGQRKVNTLACAECELSIDHITITLAIQWRRLSAGMQCLASAGPKLQHKCGGAYSQTKAFQTSRLSPSIHHLFPNKTTTCVSVYLAKSVNGEVDTSGRR